MSATRRVPFHVLASVVVALGCNPVLSDKRSSLGPEKAGVGTGPFHRAGQPCTVCHDGALGDPPEFSVAGTVFQSAEAATAASGITVMLTGADGATFSTSTNEAGNFYLSPGEFTPVYPMKVKIASGGTTVEMQSHVGWSASCAGCHADPAGPDSPGHVYFDVIGQVP